MRTVKCITVCASIMLTLLMQVGVAAEESSQIITIAQLLNSAGAVSSSPQAELEAAREACRSEDYATAIIRYYNALTASENNQVCARECIQGLQKAYTEYMRNSQVAPLMLDPMSIAATNSSVAQGWTPYYNGPGVGETPEITTHVIHKARQIKNGRFGGIDPSTDVPLCWNVWGEGVDYVEGSLHRMPYRAFLSINGPDSGAYQVANNLVAGKSYNFGCFATEGAAIVGVDPSGGTDPYAQSVKWDCTESLFALVNDKDKDTWWKRVSISFTASGPEATVFIKCAGQGSVVVHQAYLDFYEMVHGDIDGNLLFGPDNTYQEFDACSVTGTGDTGEPSDCVAGMYKQISTGQENGLLAVVRGYLNSPVGPANSYFRIGIDPTGGTDPQSVAVVWSKECWNVNNAGKWVDVPVSCSKQNSVATVFVEYKVRRKGFSGCNYLTCLLDNVCVVSSNEPAIVNGEVRRVSYDWRNEYAAQTIQGILGYLDDNDIVSQNTVDFWKAEAWEAACQPGKGAKILQNEVSPNSEIDETALQYAMAVTNYKKGHGNSKDKMKAYHNMRDMVELEQNPTPGSVSARLELARIDLRHEKPSFGVEILEVLPDDYLTLFEKVEKRYLLSECLYHCGKWRDREDYLWDLVDLSKQAGDDQKLAYACLSLMQDNWGKGPTENHETLKLLAEEGLAIENATTRQKLRIRWRELEIENWQERIDHYVQLARFPKDAETIRQIALEYPDFEYSAPLLEIAVDLYLRTDLREEAQSTYNTLVDLYPESHWTSLSTRDMSKLQD